MLQWKGYLVFEFLYQVIAINSTWDNMINCLWISFAQDYPSFFLLIIGEEVPVLDQHLLPDDVPHDVILDAGQLVECGALVKEALEQNCRNLPLLLPVTIGVKLPCKVCKLQSFHGVGERFVNLLCPLLNASHAQCLPADISQYNLS